MRRLDSLKSTDSALLREASWRVPGSVHGGIGTAANGLPPLPIDARDVAGRCLVWLLSDAPWRDFGYAGRPAVGLVRRLLQPTERTQREYVLRRELLALITAAYGASGCVDAEEIPEAVALYAADPLIYGPLGLPGQPQALKVLGGAVGDYLAVPVSQWYAVLLARVRMDLAMSTNAPTGLESGAARICERLGGIVNRLAVMASSRHI